MIDCDKSVEKKDLRKIVYQKRKSEERNEGKQRNPGV